MALEKYKKVDRGVRWENGERKKDWCLDDQTNLARTVTAYPSICPFVTHDLILVKILSFKACLFVFWLGVDHN